MKSLVKAILLIMILMLGCILCVAAQAEMWGEWQYSYDSSVGTAKITMYAGFDSSVTVPSSINGYTVTAIGENAFTGNLAKSVFLPDTVTEIQRGAFGGMMLLTEIDLGESVRVIGDLAFGECTSLTEIVLPDSITSIGAGAFYRCSKLQCVDTGSGLTSIGNTAFADCAELTVVNLGNQVQYIGDNAFAFSNKVVLYFDENDYIEQYARKNYIDYCAGGEFVDMPNISPESDFTINSIGIITAYNGADTKVFVPRTINGTAVKNINSKVFTDTGVVEVVLPEGLEQLSSGVFQDCTTLQSVTLPSTIKSVGMKCFYGCSALKSIHIPGSLTTLASSIFENCSSLESVTFDEGVQELYAYAFKSCVSLKDVRLPSTLVNISAGAFSGCTSLERIDIPEGVAEILTGAFMKCSALIEINIPDSVTVIDTSAFSGCSALEEIELPVKLESIQMGTFSNCTNLKKVVIPDGVKEILGLPFSTCPNVVLYVMRDSYAHEYAVETKLSYVIIGEEPTATPAPSATPVSTATPVPTAKPSPTPTVSPTPSPKPTIPASPESDFTIGSTGTIKYVGAGGEVVVPATINGIAVKKVGTAAFEGSQVTKVILPEGVVEILSSAFSDCLQLTSVVLPDSITEMSSYVFDNCPLLQDVRMPAGLVELGSNTFQDCTSLKSVALPDTLQKLGSNTFNNCTSLTDVTLPAGMTELPQGTFRSCTSLKKVSLPSGIQTMGASVFYDCFALQFIIIPDGVSLIDSTSFSDCIALEWVQFPASLQTVESSAFSGCEKLRSIELPSGTQQIGSTAFYGCSNLMGATIPDSVNSIQSTAFYSCPNLTMYVKSGSYAQTYAKSVGIKNSTAVNPYPAGCTHSWEYGKCIQCEMVCVHAELQTLPYDYRMGDFTYIGGYKNECTLCGLICGFGGGSKHIASDHPYENNTDESWRYVGSPDVHSTIIHFTEDTFTEEGCDWIEIYSLEGDLLLRSSGRSLADAYLEIPGGGFEIRMTSNAAVSAYGFDIDSFAQVSGEYVMILPAAVQQIKDEAMLNAAAQKIVLPENCVAIGSRAFAQNPGLLLVEIPPNVSSIASDAFESCPNLCVAVHAGSYAETRAVQLGIRQIIIREP